MFAHGTTSEVVSLSRHDEAATQLLTDRGEEFHSTVGTQSINNNTNHMYLYAIQAVRSSRNGHRCIVVGKQGQGCTRGMSLRADLQSPFGVQQIKTTPSSPKYVSRSLFYKFGIFRHLLLFSRFFIVIATNERKDDDVSELSDLHSLTLTV